LFHVNLFPGTTGRWSDYAEWDLGFHDGIAVLLTGMSGPCQYLVPPFFSKDHGRKH